ncbi:hypothetical protein QWY86_03250 [Pedobacter aquatilis]|uniref:TRADD-N-associated membrane domain-containing protein n=1 Tax=Pedobacter aquatilis TaxID=351343 RepID=UPI0025B2A251|nr:hypothetical protein [Pedobacter aquatilis]MDN3585668.1 hypothetical protein [Pedobacter aquatilis]
MITELFGHNLFSLSKTLIKAWVEKDPLSKKLFIYGLIALIGGLFILLLTETHLIENNLLSTVGYVLIGAFVLCYLSIIAYQTFKDEQTAEKEIKTKEAELRANPEDTQTAWDLARIKLESYLNRNISQVRWIFIWTVIVMLTGFGLIIYGIIRVYESPANFQPSVLVTIAGLLTEFVGVTFLIIYKSTMSQAKDYVNVLERINAVGMSIQILETVDKSSALLKDTTKAELAKELLKLYGRGTGG